MSSEAIIRFSGVRKSFGSVNAVDGADFEIRRGEFFSLLGPSGCGKTTLLRMVAGFETPTAGEIYIDDEPMSAVPPYSRPVNMVFQSYAIFPHLNVRENIAFGMRKSGLARPDLEAKIGEMLELIKLPGYGERRADELSGGQRQRVALARALIKRPKVLLLDEPLGALDKKLREQMQIELRDLQQQVGITFVFVTHDQEEALTLSDRIAVMSRGKVLEIASPTDLYESPGSRFVADFIGTMNFFQGKVDSIEAGRANVSTDHLGRVSADVAGDHPVSAGDEVTVAVRPEKIQLSLEPPGSAGPDGDAVNSVAGKMGPSAYLGDRSHCYVHVEGRDEPVLVALQNLSRALGELSRPHQPVRLTFDPGSVVLLPPQ